MIKYHYVRVLALARPGKNTWTCVAHRRYQEANVGMTVARCILQRGGMAEQALHGAQRPACLLVGQWRGFVITTSKSWAAMDLTV